MSIKTRASRLDARKVGRFCIRTAQVICGVHLFNEYIFEIRPCSGASMYPTLSHRGNYILNSPLLLRLSAPARGTLVSAISPLDPSHQILKRVIGVPGDSICVDPSGERRLGKVEYCEVPKGHVWLAGDNMSNSIDSRDYGPVPLGLLRGKVVARVWPNPGWLEPNVRPVDHI
ncbi:hypothetical protein MVLG_01305 [Microbotryum lychnidis-dioicae p1A1 Lamole]|uniref:Peptidase S26 domain-containing protein n=1 Tax=Microbotryum lychnidis-dioicae (strain p1A1 Lamole / MvSl-1064) TaxID=683840 RepID=U5H1Q2_USTV1|nr:hypothetical protein MVLG_01305 [Microbotryum lychnidis-dioicae p1A1 Lamole]|eukprot:KDE08526.1 hypothetical protein MVLG_01305 [Microbotryum lychnidis-dioicae p1A1 Lamole]